MVPFAFPLVGICAVIFLSNPNYLSDPFGVLARLVIPTILIGLVIMGVSVDLGENTSWWSTPWTILTLDMWEIPESTLIPFYSYVMITAGLATAITLLSGIRAMYGRYAVTSALTIPSGFDWFLQELPSFALPFFYIFQANSLAGAFVIFVFLVHYFNRTFIYPWQLKSSGGTPWFISLAAFSFCCFNGYLQGAWHAKYAEFGEGFFSDPITYLGVFVFFAGMAINIHSDSILRNLRKPGETGYKIPTGGLFELVSGANFLGEIVEWTGFAILARSLPSVAFAVFCASNIGPRAYQHHFDYHTKFPTTYPKDRKALVPFLL